MNNQSQILGGSANRMRWILFSVITLLFVTITVLTILALFTEIVEVKPSYEEKLLYAFILEIAAAIFGLFYSLFQLKPMGQSKTYNELTNATEEMAEYASLEHKRSRMRVADVDLEGLKGHWSSTWYLEGEEEPYVEDDIWIEEINGNEVHGKGKDSKGTYEFEGLYLRGVLTLVYKYIEEGFSLAGVIVMKVGPRSKTARGKWYGYLVEDEINGGDVIWKQA
ncbi:MAG: hypothetical protein R3211_06140 [Balneolaceae bacterium]|nr:hypothetical protein [Balneolaceae bacterium]